MLAKQTQALCLRYLQQLDKMLLKIKTELQKSSNQSEHTILAAKLADDMFALHVQVRITCNFALRGCCRLAGREVIYFDNQDVSFAGLQQQISQTVAYIKALEFAEPLLSKPALGELKQGEPILHDTAGQNTVSLPQSKFIQQYILPNMFFHLTLFYAIARSRGIHLSKGDFDGYHFYPEGFSF
ncbi:DUF1993 family protein [Catenovulum sediminis]|uniref:DUF1993 domain-containing protein n=1 Tax=Catenovulum sediminis TaxID=1740262 RepID=A0ABV1RJP0_9ALTE|nr:DUF1993 domain-containing protein [Catenovulum sediminis]